jgi:hypothetical protein
MKKNLFITLGGIGLLLTALAFLLPLGVGIIQTSTGTNINGAYTVVENFRAYIFIFGDSGASIAISSTTGIDSVPGMIAAFVLLIIGAFLQVLGVIFPLLGSKKFAGFVHFVGGLCLVTTGVLFLLAMPLVGITSSTSQVSYVLGYGFWGAAAAALVSGLLSGIIGLRAMVSKD